MDAHVRRLRVHRRPNAGGIAEAVADGILDAQGDELHAFKRRTLCSDVDADRALDGEQARPIDVARKAIEVVFAAIVSHGDTPKYARGDARFQIHPVAAFLVANELDAPRDLLDRSRTDSGRILCQQGFEPARTGREIVLLAQNGFTTARMQIVSNSNTGASLKKRNQTCERALRPAAKSLSSLPQ